MQHLVNDRHVHILMWELVEYNVTICRAKIWTCMLKFALVKNIPHTWSKFEVTQRKKKHCQESLHNEVANLHTSTFALHVSSCHVHAHINLHICEFFFFCDRCVYISTSANFQVTSTDFLFCKFSHRILQALTFYTFACMLTFQSLPDGVNKMRTEQGKAMLLWCKTTMKTSRWGHQGSSSTQNSPGLEPHLMVW